MTAPTKATTETITDELVTLDLAENEARSDLTAAVETWRCEVARIVIRRAELQRKLAAITEEGTPS